MTMTKEITQEQQERVFKWLWPDKCWHKWVHYEGDKWPHATTRVCKHCEELIDRRDKEWGLSPNPDLLSPTGMVMILDRLVEMGYCYEVVGDECGTITCFILYKIPGPKEWKGLSGAADSLPLAVFNACVSLIEKEEKE